MPKIAIYTRKSKFTGKGESIENQIKKCQDFIQFKFDVDPANAEIFIDEGFSGKNTKKCPTCGNEIPSNSKFCNNCGAKLNKVCPSCGSENESDANYFFKCGQKLDN